MARPYYRIIIGSIAVALLGACGGKKDEPAPRQDPPKVVKVADTKPLPPKGSRYDKATFLVQISFTAGERASEATAVQTHLSVVDDKLFWTRTPRGVPGERVNKALTLSAAERGAIEQIVRDNKLRSLEPIRLAKQPTKPHKYASASVKVRVDGDEHAFAVAGVTELDGTATAFSQTVAYRGVLRVISDIEAIVTRRRE